MCLVFQAAIFICLETILESFALCNPSNVCVSEESSTLKTGENSKTKTKTNVVVIMTTWVKLFQAETFMEICSTSRYQ